VSWFRRKPTLDAEIQAANQRILVAAEQWSRETAPPGWYPTPGERELFTAVRDRFQLVRKRLSNPDVLTTERIDEVIRKASLRLEPNFKKGGKK
jgi:hypothetical protein